VEKIILNSGSASETIRIGKEVGNRLRRGDVVALIGELGAGKTHFIKGLASGVGVKKSKYLSSPSFTLVNEYPGKVPFYHIDLYRLETREDAEDLGLEEYVQCEGVTVIEWADRIPSLIPKEALWIEIEYAGEKDRTIQITGKGERYDRLIKDLKAFGSKED
jgi:tRNA threonylcarbamoyladenosine biosynthesis protein TsaE